MEFRGLKYIVFHAPCVEHIENAKKRAATFLRAAKVGPWEDCILFIEEMKKRGFPVECRDADSTEFLNLQAQTSPCIVVQEIDVFDIYGVHGPADLDFKHLDEGGALHPSKALAHLAAIRLRLAQRRANEMNASTTMQAVAAALRRQEAVDPRAVNLALALTIDSARGQAPTATAKQMEDAGLKPFEVIYKDPYMPAPAEPAPAEPAPAEPAPAEPASQP